LIPDWPRALGAPVATGAIRTAPADFEVEEQLGFEPSGEGEHAFLFIEKQNFNTQDVLRRVARCAGVRERDVGCCGMKDRRAVTRQWFSVGLAGREAPDWGALESEGLRVLVSTRHRKKLRRGVHTGNAFRLVVRELRGQRDALEQRLRDVRERGVPNYFGEQRFGHGGGNLDAALAWVRGESAAPKRQLRGIYLSALRSQLFNTLLAGRVSAGNWERVETGDACMLNRSGSVFCADSVDEALAARARSGDVHPGLPLWGVGRPLAAADVWRAQCALLEPWAEITGFLEQQQLALAWRPARVLADDFCWQFCDDASLVLEFSLGAGSYATAVLREVVDYNDLAGRGETSVEQP
jgi:tRNA pseudouridine13 synthase